jgi:hypothetical protein
MYNSNHLRPTEDISPSLTVYTTSPNVSTSSRPAAAENSAVTSRSTSHLTRKSSTSTTANDDENEQPHPPQPPKPDDSLPVDKEVEPSIPLPEWVAEAHTLAVGKGVILFSSMTPSFRCATTLLSETESHPSTAQPKYPETLSCSMDVV